jgi:ATP-dependent RNA helicase DeaD
LKFTQLALKPEILKALNEMGYEELTPIQEVSFPHILSGRDLLATAETGSGKTSACGIPLVQRIDPDSPEIQALILTPTRELARQYVEEIGQIARFLHVIPFAVYGGFDMGIQKAKLANVVHILVATPGRLIDFLYSGQISLARVETFVLDEADEMMKEGFLDDINFVFSCLLHQHQTLLFSATMPPEVKGLAERYLRDPVTVQLNTERLAPQSLAHRFRLVHPDARLQALQEMLGQREVRQALIFCNSRLNAERLYERLKGRLPGVELIHGGMEQQKRSSVIRRLRARQVRFMVATDLAGRGLDFTHVTHVINYDFPRDPVIYTHRTGRAGRMGREGTAVTLLTSRELGALRRLIAANRIDAGWIGQQPDLSQSASDGHKGRRRPRGRSRGRQRALS